MRSFEFPNGEYFTNLEMYPIQPFGIGYVRIILQFVPTVILLFYFAFLSFKFGAREIGSRTSFLRLQSLLFLRFDGNNYQSITKGYLGLEMISLAVLPKNSLLILCPIAINLALEERIKAFKDNAMTNLQSLNTELDDKVRERTLDLQKANNLITESIQSASAIQSAILPSIDPSHGFSEPVYIWEPRDIVGGDFYWLQQQED